MSPALEGLLSRIERDVLVAARDGDYAYDAIKAGDTPQRARRISEAINRLMSRDLLWNVPGPRFATLTEAGRALLAKAPQ